MWFDANGKGLPAPNFPGSDTNESMKAILWTGYD
jgi:predicted oxidoreductase